MFPKMFLETVTLKHTAQAYQELTINTWKLIDLDDFNFMI